ncbi:hypothetical protein [Sphaerisporangium sp. NPDC051011]|uniref:hypothetical protein n=1 Tax=Sphaerisporangium sp. NPDC051011 TaxID=3155792 RepID=UPI0033F2216A
MPRRAITLLSRSSALLAGSVLAGAAVLATTAPAQARTLATIDIVMSPVRLGDYCMAKVHPDSLIGLYQSTLGCYKRGPGSSVTYVGQGDPYQACQYLTNDVVVSTRRGPSDSLVCTVNH